MSVDVAQFTVALLGGLGGTILLLTPGYVLGRTFARGVRSAELSGQAFVAATAIGGVVTHSIFLFWTVPLFLQLRDRFNAGEIPRSLASYAELAAWVFVVLLIAPAIIGASWARITDARWAPIERLLGWFGLSTAKRTAEAWIWAFHELERQGLGSHVMVRLRTGRTYLGTFGAQSLASSDARVRDVYLEALWDLDADEQRRGDTPTGRAVWISGEEIVAMEFLPAEGQQIAIEAGGSSA